MRLRYALVTLVAVLSLFLVMTLSSPPSSSAPPPAPPRARTALMDKAFARPDMKLTSANVALDEVLAQLPNGGAMQSFLAEQGPETVVHIDPRSGTPSGVVLSRPLVPGRGKGNQVTLQDVAKSVGRPVSELTPDVVEEIVRKFVLRNRDALGIDAQQLGA